MTKSPFTKPTIDGPRRRIPVDDAVRAAARAGMGGEQTRLDAEREAAAPSEPVAVLAVAPAPLPGPVPTAAPLEPMEPTAASAVAADPVPGPTPPPALVAAHSLPEPAAFRPVPAAGAGSEPPAGGEPTAPAAPALAPAPAVVGRRPRGRKSAPADAQPAGELKGVRISETDWSDIRKILVQLPKGADIPTNIIGYLHAAHKHYEAHLRKTGKLVAG